MNCYNNECSYFGEKFAVNCGHRDQKWFLTCNEIIKIPLRFDVPVDGIVIFRDALEIIAATGCMQSADEKEFFCKHDGSDHSIYCPAGIAKNALSKEGI